MVNARGLRFVEIICCLAIGAALSIAAGQDASWDLRNYHIYNAISVIDHRMDQDFFAADKHSGLNPLLDFIYVFLGRGPLAHAPRVLAGVMGLWYGLLLFVILQFSRKIFASLPSSERRIFVPLATLTAATGAMTISQIGTTSNDVAVAFFILTGLAFVLRAADSPTNAWKNFASGGLLFGLIGGAKLTAVVYAPALALALLFTLPFRQSLRACLAFSIAWLTGFLITFGWWGALMWQRFANPVFPMLNGVFKSPLAPFINLNDTRFLPRDAWQWIAYPLFWAWDKTNHLVYETDFRDPRLACAYVALFILAAPLLWRFVRPQKTNATRHLTQTEKIILLFFVFAYLAWLVTTSILRYAIILEILSVFVALIVTLRSAGSSRVKRGVASLLCLLCLITTDYPDWGHSAFKDQAFAVDMSWTPPHTLFLGVYEPMAYLAAFVPPQAQAQFAGLGFISYLRHTPLGQQGEQLVRNHQGPIMVLFREERRPFLQMLIPLGLSPDTKNCRAIQSNLAPTYSPPVLACEVFRDATTR